MATQLFADEELERLRELPEIGRDELARVFALRLAFVDPGCGRGLRIGLAVQRCTSPWSHASVGTTPSAVRPRLRSTSVAAVSR